MEKKKRKRKRLSPYEVAVRVIERHEQFIEICHARAPAKSNCGNYFLGKMEDIFDDGVEAGIYYHTKDGVEGPYFCFYSMNFLAE
jgi:hypothetical protein